jgi:hypothetical protein
MNASTPKTDRLAKRTRQFAYLCAFLKQQQNQLREGRRQNHPPDARRPPQLLTRNTAG